MARKISQQFRSRDHVYHFEFGIDQIAALREELTIEIVATSYSIKSQQAESINASLTLDIRREEIVIEIEGDEMGRISLRAQSIAEVNEQDAEDGESVWAELIANLRQGDGAATAFETIMEHIPVADPLLGCLLKGAISASVGQTIRCYQELTPEDEGVRQKLRSIAKCLGQNVWGIFRKATVRSLKCMATGGLG